MRGLSRVQGLSEDGVCLRFLHYLPIAGVRGASGGTLVVPGRTGIFSTFMRDHYNCIEIDWRTHAQFEES